MSEPKRRSQAAPRPRRVDTGDGNRLNATVATKYPAGRKLPAAVGNALRGVPCVIEKAERHRGRSLQRFNTLGNLFPALCLRLLVLAAALVFHPGCKSTPSSPPTPAPLSQPAPAYSAAPQPLYSTPGQPLAPGAVPPGVYAPPTPGVAPTAAPGMVPYGASGVAPAGYEAAPPAAMYAPPASAAAAPGPYGAPPNGATPTPVIVAPSPTAIADKPKSDDDDHGFDWDDLAPDVTWKKIKKAFGYGPDEKIAVEQFRQGEALFHEKNYAEAAAKFETASWRWPDSKLEEDALFLLGESYFFDDQYGKAQDAYDTLLKQHTNTRYLDTVMWREFGIAHYWEQLDTAHPQWPMTPNFNDKARPWFDTWGNAVAAYETIHLHDPTGPLADSAVMAAANMRFRAGEYEEAAYNYDIIRKDYPKSKYQMQAHLLGLQSKMRIYQGPLYDARALKDASEIAEQTHTQFRGRLGDEETHVEQARTTIYLQKAEREWALGQYYDGKKYYGAAKQYYNYVKDHYPRTPYAEQARLRIEQIRDKPDVPTNHFKWLTQIFDHDRS